MEEKILAAAFPFWARLSGQEKESFVQGCVPAAYTKGTHVHRADMGCKGVILVHSGLLRVYIVSEEGREVTLFRIRQGETCVLSASCLLDAIQFDILIEAAEDTRVSTLPAGVLDRVMESNPYVGLYLYRQAAERFSDVMWMMQQILFMGADRRVAIFLWDEMARENKTVLSMTHDEIARNIGSAREVVSKVMKYLSEEGIVALKRGQVEIRDREKLKRLLP